MTPAARLRANWPEYLAEAAGLGLFMISASVFATLIEHPALPVRQAIDAALVRRLLMGLAMGSTAVALIYSPLGARSGAHLNPATTLAFLRLGKLHRIDAVAYVVSQFAGGIAGMLASTAVLGAWLSAPEIRHVATLPGPWGHAAAFGAEAAITFLLMSVVLRASNDARWSRYTGLLAGGLVAFYITLEAPVSGMSLNPARSLGPALLDGELAPLWLYFVAPPAGMLLAAEAFARTRGQGAVLCAKLHHHTPARCIFNCRFGEIGRLAPPDTSGPTRMMPVA